MDSEPTESVTIKPTASERSPWQLIIRFMAGVAIAMGTTDALYWVWWLSRYKFPREQRLIRWDFVAVVTELIAVLLGLALAGGGILCWDYKKRGRRIVVAIAALSVIAPVVGQVLTSIRLMGEDHTLQANIVPVVIQLAQSLVLPAVLWMFFRRPEVAAEMMAE